MTPEDLMQRTAAFALRIIRLVEALPRNRVTDVIGRQLLRSGTSVGANYRSACRARSPADFISKMGIMEEEADETVYWIELLVCAGFLKKSRTDDVVNEAHQLVAIAVSSINTARKRRG